MRFLYESEMNIFIKVNNLLYDDEYGTYTYMSDDLTIVINSWNKRVKIFHNGYLSTDNMKVLSSLYKLNTFIFD